ncbi:MAG: transglycosylase SLT domain-containing protein [Candidatus Cloacimonetes bacterium]|nr:transglycosylase SLT domain-containing protein [Candidatus Cloacimonadota bacterium]
MASWLRNILHIALALMLLFNPLSLRLMTLLTAITYGLHPDIYYRQIAAESSFRPFVVSSVGAVGLGQVLPGTSRYVCKFCPKFLLFFPPVNLAISAAYTRYLVNKYSDNTSLMLAAYNWGETRVDRRLRQRLPSIDPNADYRWLFADIPETYTFISRVLD